MVSLRMISSGSATSHPGSNCLTLFHSVYIFIPRAGTYLCHQAPFDAVKSFVDVHLRGYSILRIVVASMVCMRSGGHPCP